MAKRKVQKTIWNREKPKKKPPPFFSLSSYLAIAGFIGCLIYIGYREELLASTTKFTKAVIKSPYRRRYWEYEFRIKGITYSGVSTESVHHIGDTITVKYVPDYPQFNRQIYPD